MCSRSCSILGAWVFVPTSIPTWHMMPMNDNSTMGVPNSLMVSMKEEGLSFIGSSSMGVADSIRVAKMPITM